MPFDQRHDQPAPVPSDQSWECLFSGNLELLAGITTLLRTADRLAQLAKEVDLEEEKKLIFVNKIKDIVAVASSLYLVMLSDSEKERNIRARIEIIINTLDEI